MGDANIPTDEFIVVARLGRPHGVRGWQHLQSFTEPYENVRKYPSLYARSAGQWQSLGDVAWQTKNNSLLVKLPGVESPESARQWAQTEIAVLSRDLPELTDPDEFYWRDLIGCAVENLQQQPLGKVDHVLETGAHDVLVLAAGEREVLIPFTGEYIKEVAPDQGKITVDWDPDW